MPCRGAASQGSWVPRHLSLLTVAALVAALACSGETIADTEPAPGDEGAKAGGAGSAAAGTAAEPDVSVTDDMGGSADDNSLGNGSVGDDGESSSANAAGPSNDDAAGAGVDQAPATEGESEASAGTASDDGPASNQADSDQDPPAAEVDGATEPSTGAAEPNMGVLTSSAAQAESTFGADDASSILPGTGPLGGETTCDGVDDDLNGIVDDVDAAGDGVCDCLAVATLGLHGEWGGGDIVTGWLADRIDTGVADLGDAELTTELLEPYQILLIRDVSSANNPGLSFSAAEADALWSWVREGGGLMTVIGYSDAGEVNNVNALLGAFSLGYGTDQIVQGEGSSTPVSTWYDHPIASGIEQVGADNGYPAVGQGTTIATQDGYDVGKALTIGDGHVLVWGDEWVTYESEWSGSSTYQVDLFWQNALRWLTRGTECQVPAN